VGGGLGDVRDSGGDDVDGQSRDDVRGRGHCRDDGSRYVSVHEYEQVNGSHYLHEALMAGLRDGYWWTESPDRSSRSHPVGRNLWAYQASTTIQNLVLGRHLIGPLWLKLGYRVFGFGLHDGFGIVGIWDLGVYAMNSALISSLDRGLQGVGRLVILAMIRLTNFCCDFVTHYDRSRKMEAMCE